MGTVNIWSGVGVDVQTALAATKTITAITKANPGVATSTAHGYANGNLLLLFVNGMVQLNGRVVRIANVTANTFELENVDTTLFDTFTSGTAQVITMGASAATFVDVNASGGVAADVDTTTIHDTIGKVIPGLKSALAYDFSSLWDPSDAALIELKKADDAGTYRAFAIRFKTGQKVYGAGYVTSPLTPTGSTGDKVVTPVGIKLLGPLTAYTT